MYDAKSGRFLSMDFSGKDLEEANRYRYVRNNPLNLIDPSGAECANSLSEKEAEHSITHLLPPKPVLREVPSRALNIPIGGIAATRPSRSKLQDLEREDFNARMREWEKEKAKLIASKITANELACHKRNFADAMNKVGDKIRNGTFEGYNTGWVYDAKCDRWRIVDRNISAAAFQEQVSETSKFRIVTGSPYNNSTAYREAYQASFGALDFDDSGLSDDHFRDGTRKVRLIDPGDWKSFLQPTAEELQKAVVAQTEMLASLARDPTDAALDLVQLVLDALGLIPLFGNAADGANALISVARKNYVEAAISVAAMAIFAGQAAGVAKIAGRLSKAGRVGGLLSGVLNKLGTNTHKAIEALRSGFRFADEPVVSLVKNYTDSVVLQIDEAVKAAKNLDATDMLELGADYVRKTEDGHTIVRYAGTEYICTWCTIRIPGNPNPVKLLVGEENILDANTYVEARTLARQLAGLEGEAVVDTIQKIGPLEGKVVGRQSADGSRGWRVDFDHAEQSDKGFHINWWDNTGGTKRKDQLYGAIKVPEKDFASFAELIQHGITDSYP